MPWREQEIYSPAIALSIDVDLLKSSNAPESRGLFADRGRPEGRPEAAFGADSSIQMGSVPPVPERKPWPPRPALPPPLPGALQRGGPSPGPGWAAGPPPPPICKCEMSVANGYLGLCEFVRYLEFVRGFACHGFLQQRSQQQCRVMKAMNVLKVMKVMNRFRQVLHVAATLLCAAASCFAACQTACQIPVQNGLANSACRNKVSKATNFPLDESH